MTETMFYTLMSFFNGEKCGIDIAEFVKNITNGRIMIGAGTLYTILANFLQDKLIRETKVEGRKRTYTITEKGVITFGKEVERLKQCLKDAGEL